MVRKELLIEAAPDRFFDDPHYRGYPAVLVRLKAIGKRELGALFALVVFGVVHGAILLHDWLVGWR